MPPHTGHANPTVMTLRSFVRHALLGVLAAASVAAHAATLRVASAFDPQTMDPHALALLYHSRVAFQVYDSLVGRDEQFRLEPALAQSWQMINPTTWRFKLRDGVKFHDGSTFTADDAVFSIERTLGPTSQRSFALRGLSQVKKVDEQTIDFVLAAPDAVWPEKLQYVAMMSKAWCAQHGAEKSQDFNGKQEMFTVRNAMGTGPFKLERYEPDVRVVLKRHDAYKWGPSMYKNKGPVKFEKANAVPAHRKTAVA